MAPLLFLALLSSPAPAARSPLFHVRSASPGVWLLESRFYGKGAWCNGGFVVTPGGVVLVEAYRDARAAREARRIVRRHTRQPITHVVFTHHHFDHVGGSRVFGRSTRIVAHAAVRRRLRRSNPTRARLPDLTFTTRLQLARSPRVELLHLGRGHTDGDTFVWLPDTGVLFTGDLVVHRDVGWFGHAHVRAWIRTLKAAAKLPIRTVVPGHGPIGGPRVLQDFLGYVQHVQTRVAALRRRGWSARRILRRWRLPAPYSQWRGARSRGPIAVRAALRDLGRP